jgi:hypothetical protein
MRTHPTSISFVLALMGAVAGVGCISSGPGGGGSVDGGLGNGDAGNSDAGGFNPGIIPKMTGGGPLLPGIGGGKRDAGPAPGHVDAGSGPGHSDAGPGPGPTVPANGTATCVQIVDCIQTCTTGDNACLSACITRGTAPAQTAFNTLLTCARSCSDSTCVANQCAVQVQACTSPDGSGGPGPTVGTSTCSQIIDCLDTCADGDRVCTNACRAQGTAAAQTTFNSLLACAQTCSDDACVESQCAQQLDACLGPTGPGPGPTAGTSTCGQVLTCIDACADGDNACIAACEAKATATAKTKFDALLACAQTCDGDACLQTKCATQIQTCRADGGSTGPGPTVGTSTCSQILDCLGTCAKGDTVCSSACRAKGTAAAQTTFNALVTCAQPCSDTTCIEMMCPTQVEACLGSAAPPGGGTGPVPVPSPPTKKLLTRLLQPTEPYRLMIRARAALNRRTFE